MEQTNIILNYKLHVDVFQPLPHVRITVHRSIQNDYITFKYTLHRITHTLSGRRFNLPQLQSITTKHNLSANEY